MPNWMKIVVIILGLYILLPINIAARTNADVDRAAADAQTKTTTIFSNAFEESVKHQVFGNILEAFDHLFSK